MHDLLQWVRARVGGTTPGQDVLDEVIVDELGEPRFVPGYTSIDEGDEGVEP